MILNEIERQNAIRIMEKLMNHPITKPFHDFKNTDHSEVSSIPLSPSLSIIKTRLQNGDISNTTEWINQVQSCWSTETFIQDKHKDFSPIVANECKKIFEKYMREFKPNSIENWCANVQHLHSHQLQFARKPPRKILYIVNQLDTFRKIDNEKIVPVSNAELKAFIQATNMIPPDELYRCLAKTLCELEPEFKKSNTAELWVDLTKLDMNTVRTLRDYLKAELEKHGYHYPT
ncbi:hypothetical protein M9Y10_012097 [Tritrichomonas musculus]|uniref:Bromo domain-containing protein n=1 Tax=Tritrichomonas musculus TaxID=1915356 RepID=A0ABR2IBL4_9EUKA